VARRLFSRFLPCRLAKLCIRRAVAVIDGDLQPDGSILPPMFEALRGEGFDIVIGSRFVTGSNFRSMSKLRARISRFGNRLARLVVKAELTDPMSGFFMLKRSAFDAAVRCLSPQGYKILADILASSPKPLVFKELAFEFRERRHRESKLDTLVAFEYLQLRLDKLIDHIVPVRFFLFGAIGGLGLVAHLAVLVFSLKLLRLGFPVSQAIATITAMTSNFYLNNVFTYRDQQLRGRNLLPGLFSFYAVCSIGVIANVGIASYVFNPIVPGG
jgi:dolichol-phosphate mannosyltransferase